MNGRMVEFARRFGPIQKQIEQFVIAQIEEFIQTQHVIIRQDGFVSVQKTRQEQIVLQEPTAGAPTQPPAPGRIGLMLRGSRVCCVCRAH